MDSEEAILSLICQTGLYAIYKLKQKKKEQRKREWWIRPWIARRNELGAFKTLIRELKQDDQESMLSILTKLYVFLINTHVLETCKRNNYTSVTSTHNKQVFVTIHHNYLIQLSSQSLLHIYTSIRHDKIWTIYKYTCIQL